MHIQGWAAASFYFISRYHKVQGLHQFLNYTETLEDVYYVTATQVCFMVLY